MGGISRALILSTLVVIGGSSVAAAADLLPPPPPVEPPPVAVDFGGWYLRGDVGVGINQISDLRSSFDNPTVVVPAPAFDQSSIGDSGIIGLGVGYQFNSWLRGDITGEYRTTANYRATESYANIFGIACGARCYDTYSAQNRSAVFLANLYADIGTWHGVTPYIGGGVGFVNHWFENFNDVSAQPPGGFGFAQDTSRANFAWAVMAGLSLNVTPNLKLDLGYRYLDMGRMRTGTILCQGAGVVCPQERQSFDIASHDLRLGFRYLFGGFEAPRPFLPQEPLVTKY